VRAFTLCAKSDQDRYLRLAACAPAQKVLPGAATLYRAEPTTTCILSNMNSRQCIYISCQSSFVNFFRVSRADCLKSARPRRQIFLDARIMGALKWDGSVSASEVQAKRRFQVPFVSVNLRCSSNFRYSTPRPLTILERLTHCPD
jgi:hypothetical protein